MAGEGVCFLHSPPGYGLRPVDTGWYAGFGELESGVSGQIPYAEDGSRFAGATYDVSGIYRMQAVLGWLEESRVTVADIHAHVADLQDRFLATAWLPGELVPPLPHDRGNFLTFRSKAAGDIYGNLHERGVITDYRGDRLRIGFGIYQDEADVDRLAEVLAGL
jgi:selenocysteine lyase/cysteine desulfurase